MNGPPSHHAQTLRRWERAGLRSGAVLVCLMAVGRTLSRGQMNTLVLLGFAGMLALLLANRRFAAGLCLAVPIRIKLYPAFPLIVPVLRRDWRCLAGCACGLALGLIVVPSVVLGPQGTADAYRRFHEVLIRPALGLGSDPERDKELTGATATESQSFSALWMRVPFPRVAPWLVRLFGANLALKLVGALGVTLGATFLLWGAGIFELLRKPPRGTCDTSATA